MSRLFESYLSTPEATESLSDLRVVDTMLRIEAALARAQASAALIPADAAQSIIGTCKVELFDVPKLVRESARTRCLAAPLVASLRETVALFNPQAAGFVHMGCGDHELVDTALSLVIRDMLKLMAQELHAVIDTLLALAASHADTPMLLRSSTLPVSITSLGLVCCQWVAPLVQCQLRLPVASSALKLGLGSELASLMVMRGKAPLVMAMMAAELQLQAPGPSVSDNVALACELGLLVGSLGKMANDISHLMQVDIRELVQAEPANNLAPGARSAAPSSAAMLCLVAQTAAQCMPQHVATMLLTLAQGNSHIPANWQTRQMLWPAMLTASHSITQALAQLTNGLQADTQRMRSNLDTARAAVSTADAKARFSAELLQQASALARSQITALRACPAPATLPQD